MTTSSSVPFDMVCLSHLRWDFVFQRPQHLMSRFAKGRRVFFFEEPVFGDTVRAHLESRVCPMTGVRIVVPRLPQDGRDSTAAIRTLILEFLRSNHVQRPVLWFYSPMWLEAAPTGIESAAILYDCMDELSAFKDADQGLQVQERRLLQIADLVFTGGVSLFEVKRSLHPQVHAFPSGVDITHFAKARSLTDEPADQSGIPRPRIGFAGVIDERIDLDLLAAAAALRPDWHFIMIGPTAKIDPDSLPQAPNLHWLGMKNYHDLPAYFSQWNVAMMPFALNDATRFISPTKTPEFLAAGLPVVSTPIRDVVRPYGELGLARIASGPEQFVARCGEAMSYCMGMKWRERADAFLSSMSWDDTWEGMNRLLCETVAQKRENGAKCAPAAILGNGALAHV